MAQGSAEATSVAGHLAARLRRSTGLPLPVAVDGGGHAGPATGDVRLVLTDARRDLGIEGYELEVAAGGVRLVAAGRPGLLHGTRTLRQLLPPAIDGSAVVPGPWEARAARILDRPRFAWRGAMLDVARHFFPVEDVCRYVDLLAAYKLNRLHLHLSDDQGWRIQIGSWPELTAHGAGTEVGDGPGGFYTQDDYRALVAYAEAQAITIVPEIDMPGHTNAALASYPELNADGRAPARYTGIDVGFSCLAVDRDVTYRFIDDVVGELAALTPGPFIHVGGDEVETLDDEAYARFMERVQEIVAAHGKVAVGWEEMAKAALRPTSIVQQWRSDRVEPVLRQGARLLLSPGTRTYLDMKYDPTTELGLEWAGHIEVRDAYDWDPTTLYPGVTEDDVVGVEAPIWTETLRTLADVERMALPRLPGIAEIGWSPASSRTWEEYRLRLAAHAPRWAAMGALFHRSPQVPWDA